MMKVAYWRYVTVQPWADVVWMGPALGGARIEMSEVGSGDGDVDMDCQGSLGLSWIRSLEIR